MGSICIAYDNSPPPSDYGATERAIEAAGEWGPPASGRHAGGPIGSRVQNFALMPKPGAQGVPFVGAPELEGLAHRHLAHRLRVAAGRGQFAEHLLADPDNVLDQEPRH